ncbi:MAG: dihydrodipicolinate synthase family protein, partial [Oxalobacteraceae bacterium]
IYTAFRTDLYAHGFPPAMVKRALYLQDPSVGASRQPALLPNAEQDARIGETLKTFGLL